MFVLGGGHNHRSDFLPAQQFVQVGSDQISSGGLAQRFGCPPIDITQPEPAHGGMLPGKNRADTAHRAAADDGETDAVRFHDSSPRSRAALPPAIRSRSASESPSTWEMRPRGSPSPMS